MTSWRDTLLAITHDVETRFDELKHRFIEWKGRDDPIGIEPYRGYVDSDGLWMRGRVLEEEIELGEDRDTFWANLQRMIERYDTEEVPGARVRAEVAGRTLEVESDDEGYFEVRLELDPDELPADRLWHEVRLELLEPEQGISATGHVIAPRDATFAVVSDIDDTVVETGASDRLKMARVQFLNNATTRLPFSGVAPFYQALSRGEGDQPRNPIFYVSSSPWNLYDLFAGFMEIHDLPAGPLFLKDFGVSEGKLFKSGHETHKLERIGRLLDTYPDLRFILVGDSGQEDPEIYRQAVGEHPERFLAVYIRDVTSDERDAEVHEIADEVEAAGVPMLLVDDTVTAARHAIEQGWIAASCLEEVESAASADRDEPGLLERLLGG